MTNADALQLLLWCVPLDFVLAFMWWYKGYYGFAKLCALVGFMMVVAYSMVKVGL